MDQKWIFFDVGFTLVDETDCYADYVKRCVTLLKDAGVDVSAQEYYQQMITASQQGLKPIKTVRESYASRPKPTWRYDGERLFSDTHAALTNLAERYQLGIIANQGAGLTDRLAQHGILDYFELIVSSHDLGIKKPAPEIFEHALTLAGATAAQCVYVGDRCDNDIIPAKKLGFTTVRMLQGLGAYQPEHDEYRSDFTIQQLTELTKRI